MRRSDRVEAKLQILLVRPWVADQRAIRDALAEAGLAAELTIVDFEASLNAALSRRGFAVVIYDRETPGLSRDTLDACMRANKCDVPVVELGDALAARVAAALAARGN